MQKPNKQGFTWAFAIISSVMEIPATVAILSIIQFKALNASISGSARTSEELGGLVNIVLRKPQLFTNGQLMERNNKLSLKSTKALQPIGL